VDAAAGLGALFVSSFVSATLFPGGSEAVLWGVVHADNSLLWPAILVATAGNTLGGLSSYVLGRVLPRGQSLRGIDWVRRHGAPVLLLSWLPFIGDGLCVAAGWLRMNPVLATVFIGAGKFARYCVVAAIT
jgi:membrane protein YqaA with SNARE-associated domain